MSTAADLPAGGAELRHRQVQEASLNDSDGVSPGSTTPMDPFAADQAVPDGGINKPKKTFGRTPDGTGKWCSSINLFWSSQPDIELISAS
jgi:phosphatidylethanolamine N-methyltransferase